MKRRKSKKTKKAMQKNSKQKPIRIDGKTGPYTANARKMEVSWVHSNVKIFIFLELWSAEKP